MRSTALAFLAGVLLVHQFAAIPSLWWSLLLLPLLALALWRPIWSVPLFFVASIVWTAFRADFILSETLAPTLEGLDIDIEGYVVDLPRSKESIDRFAFDVMDARANGQTVSIPRRILLFAREDEIEENGASEYMPGSYWQFTVRLKRPHGFANPGGFDYEAYLFRNRIRARGYVRQNPPPRQLDVQSTPRLIYRVNQARADIGQSIHKALADSPSVGIVMALGNGDQSKITPEQWQVLRRTGTLHLVAISGLHISLVAGLVFLLFRYVWSLPGRTVLWVPAQTVGAIGGLIAAGIYAALAGFTIPTQRALIMVAVAMAAIIGHWRVSASWVLAAALLAVLIFDPFSVMAAGFWLSFAAVAVIVFVTQRDDMNSAWWRRLVSLQWAIALGMLPLMLVIFHQASLISPVANMIAIPVFDIFVVPLTLLGVGLRWLTFDGLGAVPLELAAWLLSWLWTPLEMFSQATWAQWHQHEPPPWAVVCGVIGVVLILAPRGWPGRWLGFFWMAPLVFAPPAAPAHGALQFALLDVGQGLAAVVRTAQHTLVYDTGPRFSATFDTGAAVVVPYLQAKGVTQIDTLVVSHGDNDHIGGFASMQSAYQLKQVLSNVTAPVVGAVPCRAGHQWEWDGVGFQVLSPAPDQDPANNNGSCVLHVTSPFGSVLLPGDIERATEKRLVAHTAQDLAATILVAPHHGSRTSSTVDFIDMVAPRQVLFAAGYRSRYRHPHPSVVKRYESRGINVANTATSGAIEVSIGAEGISTRQFRQDHPRFWRSF